jgi:hypothetical protein
MFVNKRILQQWAFTECYNLKIKRKENKEEKKYKFESKRILNYLYLLDFFLLFSNLFITCIQRITQREKPPW